MTTAIEKRSRKFFGCYLLISRSEESKFKGRTYIGFTVDPVRRLRQHNSGVKSGGARRTNNRGPWDMILVVFGFPNEISALRFEWAWQHPQESRRLQLMGLKKGNREKQCNFRLRVLSSMINSGPWNRLSLTVCWLREDYRQQFSVSLDQPQHVPVIVGLSDPKKVQERSETQSTVNEIDHYVQCSACDNSVSSKEQQLICPACRQSFHIECLAKSFLNQDTAHIIPIGGVCPMCEKHLLWGDLIRSCF